MAANRGLERTAVQDPFIRYATEIGWGYLPPEEALTLRRGTGGLFLYQTLAEKLVELNPGVVTVDSAREIIARLEAARSNLEGNALILQWLRGTQPVFVEGDRRQIAVNVVDYDHPANNVFHVTDEWEYTNGQHTNAADIMFLVNGIPVAIAETKSARRQDGIDAGVGQIRRYHRETPEMLTAPQVFDVTHLLDFYYGATWNLDRKDIYNWKDEERGNFERKVKQFFSRERFLKLLREWIIVFKKDDELKKVILRQHQTRAVEKCLDRSLAPDRRRGLIWHTQGSGKTFTMIKTAEMILDHPAFRNDRPTVIMLVDRNELEGQLKNWVASLLGERAAELADSKERLRELLRADYRGLVIAMIHKFDRADEGLCARSNVFVLVDEAHRTTGGDLGNYLVAALPNATLLGFTGTPIDRTAYGQGTFKVFGVDDQPKGYLDKYSIRESLEDGTTVRLHYSLAANEVLAPRDILEKEFLALRKAEGVSDIEELNKILDEAIQLKTFLKVSDRVEKVAQFVAQHYREKVEPLGYKAFLVGVDRQACALYKQALDKHLPGDYSTVVYTSHHNDEDLLKKYRLSDDAERKVRKAFPRRSELPKILIVTEKLLTGYDAPVLYCMYLDKPMRDHALLQAIARVNRPYEDAEGIKKPCGLVIDFVGIFDKLEKALAFDSDEVESVIKKLDVLKDRFAELMKGKANEYLPLCPSPRDDKAIEAALDALADKDAREAFYEFFRELQSLYEILSPDDFLREHMGAYHKLLELYIIARNKFRRRHHLYKDIAKKTEMLVRQRGESFGIQQPTSAVPLDETALEALKTSEGTKPGRILNLARRIIDSAEAEGEQQPYLIPIGIRVEAVIDKLDDRQVSTAQAVTELEKLVREYLDARKEREQSGMDPETFAVYWVLKGEEASDPAATAKDVVQVLARHPNFAYNSAERRALKAALYKLLLPIAGKDRMVDLAEQILKPRRPMPSC